MVSGSAVTAGKSIEVWKKQKALQTDVWPWHSLSQQPHTQVEIKPVCFSQLIYILYTVIPSGHTLVENDSLACKLIKETFVSLWKTERKHTKLYWVNKENYAHKQKYILFTILEM